MMLVHSDILPIEGGSLDGLQTYANGIQIGQYVIYGSHIIDDEVYSPDDSKKPTKLIYKGKAEMAR